MTFTPNGVPTSGTLGGSLGQASRTYTDTPTTIIANGVLDVYTGQTTFLLGAMLNSKAGKLKLDTGNFVFDHFGDKDFARNVSVSLNIDPNRPDANGSYYYHDKQGVTYATVGAGTINIRNAPTTSLIALNRDAANIQRVVKDETINIKIPGVNLVALVNDVNNSVNYFRALAADVPDSVGRKGRQASDEYLDAILCGATPAEAARFLSSPEGLKQLEKRNSWDEMQRSGKYSAEVLARAAYLIAQGEQLYFDAADKKLKVVTACSTNDGGRVCGIAIEQLATLSKGQVLGFIDQALADLKTAKSGLERDGKFQDAYRCALTWYIWTGDRSSLDTVMSDASGSYWKNLSADRKAQLTADATRARDTLNSRLGPLSYADARELLRSVGIGLDNGAVHDTWSPLDFIGPGVISAGTKTVAALAGRVFFSTGATTSVETVTIYRAVSLAEYESIGATNSFTLKAGAMESKQFGLTLQETLAYANTNPDYVAIVAASVPKSALNPSWITKTIDPFIFKSGVVTVPGAELQTLNQVATKIWQPKF